MLQLCCSTPSVVVPDVSLACSFQPAGMQGPHPPPPSVLATPPAYPPPPPFRKASPPPPAPHCNFDITRTHGSSDRFDYGNSWVDSEKWCTGQIAYDIHNLNDHTVDPCVEEEWDVELPEGMSLADPKSWGYSTCAGNGGLPCMLGADGAARFPGLWTMWYFPACWGRVGSSGSRDYGQCCTTLHAGGGWGR